MTDIQQLLGALIFIIIIAASIRLAVFITDYRRGGYFDDWQ